MERHFAQTQSSCFLSSVYPCLLAVSWIELTNDATKGHKHVGPTAEISRSLQWAKLSHNEKGATYTIFVHGTNRPTCKWIRIFMWVYKSQGILCMHFIIYIYIYCKYTYIYIHLRFTNIQMNPQICNDNMFFFIPTKDTKMVATSHHGLIDQAFSLWSLGGHWWHRWPGEDLRGLPDIWEETLLETNISPPENRPFPRGNESSSNHPFSWANC